MENAMSDDAIMREIAHMNQVISRRARRREGAVGAPYVLAILASHEEAIAEGFTSQNLTQVELADIVGIRPQSLGALLVQLEADGCIKRVACEEDRRAHRVILTDRGRNRAEKVRASQRVFATETLEVLTPEEKHQLGAIVTKLNKWLS